MRHASDDGDVLATPPVARQTARLAEGELCPAAEVHAAELNNVDKRVRISLW